MQWCVAGSCWAFAAVATIESAYAIAKEVEPPVLSEQELIDCDDYDSGCLGGWPERAFRWLKRHGGLASASQYPPYDSKKHACRKEKRLPHAVSLRDYKYVSKGSEHYYKNVDLSRLGNRCCPGFPTGNTSPGQKGCPFVPGLATGTKEPTGTKRGC